jgi:O-antigen/teichoic acid export membrane protein
MADTFPPAGGITRIVVRGVGLAASGFVLSNFLTIASYLVLARLVTPREFGVLAAGSLLVYLSATFVESGLAAALVRRDEDVDEAASTVFFATAVAGAGFALLALAASPLVGHFFGSGHVGAVAAAMAGILFLRSLGIVPNTLLQMRFSFLRRVVVAPSGAFAFGVTAITATASGWGVWGLVLGSYVSTSVELVLAWAFARWRPRPRLASFAMWRSLAAFGRHVLAADIVMGGADKVDAVVIGRLLSTAALGQYRYAWRVAVLPLTAVVNVAAYVLYPAFARIADDDERFRAAFLRALRWLSIVGLPASLILLPLGEPLVVLAFGRAWLPAGRALTAMCFFAAGHTYDSLASEGWKAAGRPDMLPRMHVLSAVSLVVLMLAFLPFGLTGMGAALSLSSLAVAVYALRGAGHVLGIAWSRLVDEIWPPALAAAAMAGALFALERGVTQSDTRGVALGLALIATEALLGVAMFLAVLLTVRPDRRRELGELIRLAAPRHEPIALKPSASVRTRGPRPRSPSP